MSNFYFNVNERCFTLIQGRENEALTELSNLVENKKYNLGELVIGKNGKLDRINSHESSFFSNNKITKPDENRMVRTAVLQTLSKVKNPNGDNSDAFKYISKVMTGKDFIELPLTRREVCAYLKILKGEIQLTDSFDQKTVDSEIAAKADATLKKINSLQEKLNTALKAMHFDERESANMDPFVGCKPESLKDALRLCKLKAECAQNEKAISKEAISPELKNYLGAKASLSQKNEELLYNEKTFAVNESQVEKKDVLKSKKEVELQTVEIQLREQEEYEGGDKSKLIAKLDKLTEECDALTSDIDAHDRQGKTIITLREEVDQLRKASDNARKKLKPGELEEYSRIQTENANRKIEIGNLEAKIKAALPKGQDVSKLIAAIERFGAEDKQIALHKLEEVNRAAQKDSKAHKSIVKDYETRSKITDGLQMFASCVTDPKFLRILELKTELSEVKKLYEDQSVGEKDLRATMLKNAEEAKVVKIFNAEHGVNGSFRTDLDGLNLAQKSAGKHGPSRNVLNKDNRTSRLAYLAKLTAGNAPGGVTSKPELQAKDLMKAVIELDHYNQLVGNATQRLFIGGNRFGPNLRLDSSVDDKFREIRTLIGDRAINQAVNELKKPEIANLIGLLSRKQGFVEGGPDDLAFRDEVNARMNEAITSALNNVFSDLESYVVASLGEFNQKIADPKMTDRQKAKLFDRLLDDVARKINEATKKSFEASRENHLADFVLANCANDVAQKLKMARDKKLASLPVMQQEKEPSGGALPVGQQQAQPLNPEAERKKMEAERKNRLKAVRDYMIETTRNSITEIREEIELFRQFKMDETTLSRMEGEIHELENKLRQLNVEPVQQQGQAPNSAPVDSQEVVDIGQFIKTDEMIRNVMLFDKFSDQKVDDKYRKGVQDRVQKMRINLGILRNDIGVHDLDVNDLNNLNTYDFTINDVNDHMQSMSIRNNAMLYLKSGLDWELLSNYVDFGFALVMDNSQGVILDAVQNVVKDVNALLGEPLNRDNIIKAGKLLEALRQMKDRVDTVMKMGTDEATSVPKPSGETKPVNNREAIRRYRINSKGAGKESKEKALAFSSVMSGSLDQLNLPRVLILDENKGQGADQGGKYGVEMGLRKTVNDSLANQLHNLWKFSETFAKEFSTIDFTDLSNKFNNAVRTFNASNDGKGRPIDAIQASKVVWKHQKDWDAYTKDFSTFATQQLKPDLVGGGFDAKNPNQCQYSLWGSNS